jgi:hypothetical protein
MRRRPRSGKPGNSHSFTARCHDWAAFRRANSNPVEIVAPCSLETQLHTASSESVAPSRHLGKHLVGGRTATKSSSAGLETGRQTDTALPKANEFHGCLAEVGSRRAGIPFSGTNHSSPRLKRPERGVVTPMDDSCRPNPAAYLVVQACLATQTTGWLIEQGPTNHNR